MKDKIIVPFAISATNVNTLDTAPVTLATVSVATGMCLVPVRLEIWRAAGTKYTINPHYKGDGATNTNALYPYPDKGQYASDENMIAPHWVAQEFIVYDLNTDLHSSRTDRNQVYFRIPMDTFVNTPDANGLVVFPEGGLALRAAETVILKIEALTGISGGSGALSGRVFFDEFPAK